MVVESSRTSTRRSAKRACKARWAPFKLGSSRYPSVSMVSTARGQIVCGDLRREAMRLRAIERIARNVHFDGGTSQRFQRFRSRRLARTPHTRAARERPGDKCRLGFGEVLVR